MTIRHMSARASDNIQTAVRIARRPRWEGATAATLAAARTRLAASNRRHQRRTAPTNEIYYPPRSLPEQTIDEIACLDSLDAVVTRNHYGSLVLNAYHALFIDVDLPAPGNPARPGGVVGDESRESWQTIFEDLCTVLGSERDIGFRIYRTAAGFRVLSTTHEFEPGSESARSLMTSVGADDAFVRLCGTQKTFRARLTPKPWRCGTTHPPNQFPRQSPDEQRRFTEWLTQYECACRHRATCRFLAHVGAQEAHERVAPIIEFHDRETRAFKALELA